MQSAAKTSVRKTGFKCPSVSVPASAKSISEQSSNGIKKGKEQLNAKLPQTPHEQSPVKPMPSRDSNNGKAEEESRSSSEVEMTGDNGIANPIEVSEKPVKLKKQTKFQVKPVSDGHAEFGYQKIVKDKKSKKDTVTKDIGDKNEAVVKQKKQKEQKEAKEPIFRKKPTEQKEPKEKNGTKEKAVRETLPVRSLTDEEYHAIFDAAIENALKLNMEEWLPKTTSPVKAKKSVKKKYSVTVGKKSAKKLGPVTSQHCYQASNPELNQEHDTQDKEHEVSHGLDTDSDADRDDQQGDWNQEKNPIRISEPVYDDRSLDEMDDGGDAVQIDENNNIVPDLEDDGEDENAEDIVENHAAVEESAQQRNETTPAGSEADLEEKQPTYVARPIKKKKLSKSSKCPKLEPKQLPFESKAETSMVDKIPQMKKLKRDQHEVPTRKRKLENLLTKKHQPENIQAKLTRASKDVNRQKCSEKKVSKRKQMQDRELELNGTWVQCCNSTCLKWRYQPDVTDPSQISERWTCNMNPNMKYNRCDKAEEAYDETEHIYTKVTEGSVVWARMTGYPWWPALVEIDPDVRTFFSIDSSDSMIPTHYHVVFFDERVSRCWVKTEHVKQFTGSEEADSAVYQIPKKGPSYTKEIAAAKKNASRALICTIKERIELFGFAARYKGPWSSGSRGKNKAPTRKQKVAGPAPLEEDYLDDSTMDDILDNTEELLDNVEEMLDSLESPLPHSDAGSDFMPDELVVIERKKKHAARTSSVTSSPDIAKQKKKRVRYTPVDSDSKEEINSSIEKPDLSLKDVEVEVLEAKPKATTSSVEAELKLDSDIFTMEMDSDDGTARGKKEKCGNNKITAKTDKNVKAKEGKAKVFQVSAAKNKKIRQSKKKEAKTIGKNKENNEEIPKEDERDKHTCTIESRAEKLTEDDYKAQSNSDDEFDLNINNNDKLNCSVEAKAKHLRKDENKAQEKVKLDIMSDADQVEGKNGHKTVVEQIDQLADDDESDYELDVNVVESKLGGVKSDKKIPNTSISEKELGGEDMNNDKELETNNVVGSMSEDEIDLNEDVDDKVPDIDGPAEHEVTRGNTEQSLEDDSDSEFDLEEHFMYETNTDGSDKVRERGLTVGPVNAVIGEVDEDSDPFDMMEE